MSTGTQTEVVMPQMGVSVSEGTITKWLKQPGEQVARDEPLLEISTDKVDTEVPSPGEGVLTQILVPEGETVDVGTVLATIGPAGSAPAEPVSEAAPAEPEPAEEPSVTTPEQTSAAPEPQATAAAPAPSLQPQAAGNGRTFVSPVVARIASEHGVDPSTVPGTGAGGRVTKKDILAFIESGAAAPAPMTAARQRRLLAPTEPPPAAPTPAAAPPPPAAAPAAPAMPEAELLRQASSSSR